MNKLVEWLNKKKAVDNFSTQFLKLLFSVGKQSWIHSIVSAILGIIIPIFFQKGHCILSFILIGILICDIIYAFICNSYKDYSYRRRKFSSEILTNQSSLLKSIVIDMGNNHNWQTRIFKIVSELICEKIYSNFKEIFHCDVRVAVEYVFNKPNASGKNVKYVKMSGRRSNNRAVVRKAKELEKRNKYFSYKIFTNNNEGINILNESEIQDDKIWYKNPKDNVNVKRYIGIAESVHNDGIVNYILEIDFIDEFNFGDNNSNDAIKTFIQEYLTTYINIISLSYLLNLNKKTREIPEV